MRISAWTLLAAIALTAALASPTLAQGANAGDPPSYELATRDKWDTRDANANRSYDPLVDLAQPQPAPMYAPGGYYAPQAESPWAHLGLYGNVFYWMYGGPQYFNPPPPDPPGPSAKKGMFQRLLITESWLAGGDGATDMGVNDIELKTVLALPLGCLATPLILTPGLGAHYFDGPLATDVPGHTYEFYLDVRWMRQVSPCVGIDLAVTPGWYSDLETDSDEALRIGARGIALITCSPTFQIAVGAVYLDRDDVPLLPLGGVIWAPHDDFRAELMAPRPKVARRISCSGSVANWVYVAGEFGGGSWAIQRASGADDVLNYRDYRAILGVERTDLCGGLTGRIEAGYVFGRAIEYQSVDNDFDIDDTYMVRAELSY